MFRRLSALAACAICGLSATACSYATVGSGEIGVVWTPDGKPRSLPEGEWGVGTYERTTLYNTRSQEHEERLEVLAANGLRIVLDTSIRYHIVADEAVALDHELGVHYYDVLVGPTLKSQARRVVGRYQPEEIYSTQRELIERQIRDGVEGAP
jgi:regulator of protease activity HflC (stomatin/prohibitin superfamily)